jgi:V/A-type H+-transporting ATPase subunit I
MCEVSIIVHKSYFDELLEALHESGYIQIFETNKSKLLTDKNISSAEPPLKRSEVITDLNLNINRIIDILKKARSPPANIYQELISYKPPRSTEISPRPVAELIKDARNTIRELDFVTDIDSEISSSQTRKNNLLIQREKLLLFEKMNIDLSLFEGTQNIVIKAGLTDKPAELSSELSQTMSKEAQRTQQFALYFHPAPEGFEGYIAIVIIPKNELANTRRVFVGRFFKELELTGFEGTPDGILRNIKSEEKEVDRKLQDLKNKLQTAYKKHFQLLSMIQEELEIARKKYQVHTKFGETATTNIICGWCQKSQQDRLKNLCENVTRGHVTISVREPKINPGEDVPIKLQNPKWAKPFEMLTRTFAYPKYNEIDPTVVIAPLFILFFGIMLGDAGYGLIILILSIFGYSKFGKASRTIKNLSALGIYAGIMTVIMGILMGAFFGDLIPRFIYRDPDVLLYSAEIAGITFPYDSFRNPMLLFGISLMIGLLILNLGLMLGAVQNIRTHSIKRLITNQLAWFIIQPPAILLIGHSLLKLWQLSDIIFYISVIFLLIGLILLAVQYQGFTLFEITGFMSDWLSFVRLLALSLATMGMALTFNIMAELILNLGYDAITVGIFTIIAGILLLILHIFNLGIQTLGASIHSLRLQYIELFNRCYEGGGKEFKPFHSERSYTKLKKTTDRSN